MAARVTPPLVYYIHNDSRHTGSLGHLATKDLPMRVLIEILASEVFWGGKEEMCSHCRKIYLGSFHRIYQPAYITLENIFSRFNPSHYTGPTNVVAQGWTVCIAAHACIWYVSW